MRIAGIGAAVLVAAALSVTLTGVASAGEPDDDRDGERADVVIVRCEDGELVRREPTDEERERMRALPTEPGWIVGGERAERSGRVEGVPQRGVHVVPAEPAEPGAVECAVAARP